MVNTAIDLGNGLKLRNPVLTASGTFGYGLEYDDFFDVSALGGFVVKGTTLMPREGNPYPRLAETPSGMLNAVGLQNKGVDYFCKNIYPKLTKYTNNVIVNVSGSSIDDYVKTAEHRGVGTYSCHRAQHLVSQCKAGRHGIWHRLPASLQGGGGSTQSLP